MEDAGVGDCANGGCSRDELRSQVSAATSRAAMRVVQIVQVLQELQDSTVRRDFLSGKIISGRDLQQHLNALDSLLSLLLPDFRGANAIRMEKLEVMGYHLRMLLEESEQLFPLGSLKYSYAAWKRALDLVINSSYWSSKTRPNVAEASESELDLECLQENRPKLRRMKTSNNLSKDSIPKENGIFGFTGLAKGSESMVASFECIEIEESSEEDPPESEDSSDSCESVPAKKHYRYFPKDVVAPECFSEHSKLSLKTFLNDYERYFSEKFSGNQRDRCRELGRFLEGDIKDAYSALGGAQLKYSNMKTKLVDWYKSQQVGRTVLRKAELNSVTMREGETFKLYCMRLKELACRAYPNDDREALKQLRKRLVETVPSWFVTHIEKKKELKRMLGVGKLITWNDIVEIAEMQDRKFKKKVFQDSKVRSGPWGEYPLVVSATQTSSSFEKCPETGDVKDEQQRNYPDSGKFCNYCGRVGHLEVWCRLKSGVCYVCGQPGHFAADCRNPPSPLASYQPRCSRCRGSHLGKDCPNKPFGGGQGKVSTKSSSVNSGLNVGVRQREFSSRGPRRGARGGVSERPISNGVQTDRDINDMTNSFANNEELERTFRDRLEN